MAFGSNTFAPAGAAVQVSQCDELGNAILVKCATGSIPSAAKGYAKGCMLINTTTGALSTNTGTAASCTFTPVNTDSAGNIALADGKMIMGNAQGVGAAVTPSGDVTINNAGVATIGAAKVTGAMLTAKKGYFTASIATNGATPVNVFGAGGAPAALTVTEVIVNALDTSAGNITLKQGNNTVVAIAKSETAGVMTGAGALTNTVYAASDACTVVSSGGDARVTIHFTVA